MRHLVTGGAGVIGFELVRQLVEQGDEVTTLDVGKKGGLQDLAVLAEQHPGQLTVVRGDFGSDRSLLSGRFDAIFHFAAIVGVKYVTDHPYETISVNMRTTLNALDHALQTGCRTFIFASSSENYAASVDHGHAQIPTGEDVLLSIDDIALPRWSYAASKMAGESAVFGAARIGGFTPIVVRFHNVYGPRMGPTHVIPEFLERVRQRADPFPVFGADQTRSFLHVEDGARALRAVLGAALEGQGGIYNIGSAIETQIGDLARMVFEVTGFHPKIDDQPAPPGSVRRRVPDVAKLRALGFEPRRQLREGLAECWAASAARATRP